MGRLKKAFSIGGSTIGEVIGKLRDVNRFAQLLRDLIGWSIVIYATEDKSDAGLAGATIARIAGVGDNYKKLCTCDGTTIWEAKPNFVTSKV